MGKPGFNHNNSDHVIPKRSLQAIEDLVDLSDYYTSCLDESWFGKLGDNLSAFPKGIQAFEKAAFDVRGLIQLAGKKSITDTKQEFPQFVKNIITKVGGLKIHFLQGTRGITQDGTVVGKYVIHYEGGQTLVVPITYGTNVKDFWAETKDSRVSSAEVAWVGTNDYVQKKGIDIRLYKFTINNPYVELKIDSIDFVSEITDSAPFLIAITVDRSGGLYERNYEWFDAIKVSNPIVARDSRATKYQVDLSDYYHASLDDDWFNHPGHDLHDVPKGLQVFGGVMFDVRGLIATGSQESLRVSGLALPEVVADIRVNCSGPRVNFLHFAAFGPMKEGYDKTIGKYVVNYRNGEKKQIPIIYQENTIDWWIFDEGELSDPNAVEAWSGSNAATRMKGMKTRLIRYTWENPLPNEEITTIDFVSNIAKTAPLLVAITVEPE